MKKYSENELATLINEVEAQFSSHLKKEEKKIVKEKKLEKKEGATQKVASLEKSETTEKVVAKAEKESEVLDYSEEDISEMNKMYSSMTKSEKEAHYSSIKSVLFTGDKSDKVVEKKEEILVKTEKVKSEEVEKLQAKLEKSEKDNEDLNSKLSGLITQLTKSVKKESAPKQKAITKIEYVAKSEETSSDETSKEDVAKLNTNEITKRLNEKARNPSLSKSDREAINTFCLEKGTSLDLIKHLL